MFIGPFPTHLVFLHVILEILLRPERGVWVDGRDRYSYSRGVGYVGEADSEGGGGWGWRVRYVELVGVCGWSWG